MVVSVCSMRRCCGGITKGKTKTRSMTLTPELASPREVVYRCWICVASTASVTLAKEGGEVHT